MMHEEICTYEVCKLAKEKGLPQDYIEDTKWWGEWSGGVELLRFGCKGCDIFAPTQSLLQRWLREEKKYAISVFWDMLSKYYRYEIVKTIGVLEIQVEEKYYYSNPKGFDTYELALEDAELYCLENLL